MTIRPINTYATTKNFFLSFCVLFLFSCNSKNDFYFGVWKSNNQNNFSVEIKKDSTITWKILDNYFFENTPFKLKNESPKKARLEISVGFPLEIDIESCSPQKDQCIITSYKSYINENLIDEVILASKDGRIIKSIKKPKKQIIQLPDSFNGEFFIIYQEKKNQDLNIQINAKGIGYSLGKPELLQLFNANREFRFKNSKAVIEIANPNNYSKVNDSSVSDNEYIIIQHGFNQSGRNAWNRENKLKITENLNIEYFELKRKNAR